MLFVDYLEECEAGMYYDIYLDSTLIINANLLVEQDW